MTDEAGHVLVVDDNKMNRLKLSISLEQQGHTVSLAEDGQQALALLAIEPFDVVLLDLIMPGMDGFQVLEKIKGDSGLRDIPVIVISAVDELDSVVRCIEMGAEDYLPKSYDPVLLRARLGSSLQKKKLRDLEKIYLQQEMMLRQSEKLITLGKLSAGMAHELNNPSAAAQRGAAQLQITFSKLQQTYLSLCRFHLTETQLSLLADLDQMAQARSKKPVYLDALTRSDSERALETWMDEQKVENAWEIAPTLVSLGYQQAELERLLTGLSSKPFVAAIEWLNASATIYSLAEEISQGAGHISEIVKALKTYTYMDQAPIQTVDVHESLDNTLIILRSKLASGVSVKRDFAANLPNIEAYGSELNQVWTNIIDNAIDAMQGKGEIVIRTRYSYPWVTIEIEDNGPGIPESILPNIFDPFFTTKSPGKGTGLGLNISHNVIVQKHHGRVSVSSHPGKTCFEVRLPLRLSTEKE